MKNIIKKGHKFLKFKAKSFECGDGYSVEINGERYDGSIKFFGPSSANDGLEPMYDSSNVSFVKELIPDTGSIPDSIRLYPGQKVRDTDFKAGVYISISIPADRFAAGDVKLFRHGEKINPDDVLTDDDDIWVVDEEKVHLGSIWNLTIDDDPRFQNTLIMITRIWGGCVEFAYQTHVQYTPDYTHIEAAEGRIDLNGSRNRYNPVEINEIVSKVHLTLVKDNTNGGAVMDRQHEDEIVYPRSYGIGGYREQYPPIEFRKRIKRNPDEDYDEDDDF